MCESCLTDVALPGRYEITIVSSDGDGASFSPGKLPWLDLKELAPARAIINYRGRTSNVVWYMCLTMRSHVVLDSSLEELHCMTFDRDREVTALLAQPMAIAFWPDDPALRPFSHVPDFALSDSHGRISLVDVHVAKFVGERSRRQFAMTAALCHRLGWSYRVVHDLQPAHTANLRHLRM